MVEWRCWKWNGTRNCYYYGNSARTNLTIHPFERLEIKGKLVEMQLLKQKQILLSHRISCTYSKKYINNDICRWQDSCTDLNLSGKLIPMKLRVSLIIIDRSENYLSSNFLQDEKVSTEWNIASLPWKNSIKIQICNFVSNSEQSCTRRWSLNFTRRDILYISLGFFMDFGIAGAKRGHVASSRTLHN